MYHYPCLRATGKTALVLILIGTLTSVLLGNNYRVHVVDPAITDELILPTGPLPEICRRTNEIRLSACRGEYVPASFVLTAKKPLKRVLVEVEPLAGPGHTWPKESVDIRVVKEYYRECFSGRRAVLPTLLVHDESFLGIEPAPTEEEPNRIKNVAKSEVRDRLVLQPVQIGKGKHKQFWITVHVPENASAGTYKGTVRIVPENSKACELTLQIEVYPFDLLEPMLEYSIYYPARLLRPEGPQKFMYVRPEQYRLELQNMLAHGITNPNIYLGPSKKAQDKEWEWEWDFSLVETILNLRESVGIRPKTLYMVDRPFGFFDRPLKPVEREEIHYSVNQFETWAKERGYKEVYYMAADEWSGEKLAGERDSMLAVHEGGGKVFVACGTDFYDSVGDVLDLPILLVSLMRDSMNPQTAKFSTPEEELCHFSEIGESANLVNFIEGDREYRKVIDGVHRMGKRIFVYMHPTAGAALPNTRRRNDGLGLWRSGFDGSTNWSYIHNFARQDYWPAEYPPLVDQAMEKAYVYRTSHGVIDTMHWEGFREGVDDVRYLTTLLTTLNQVMGRFPQDPMIEETISWLAEIDVANGDLQAIRRGMAERIIALQGLGYCELAPERILEDIDLEQVQVITFPEPWRFKIDPNDQGVNERWFGSAIDYERWSTIRTDKKVGWEKQGFGKNPVGYGWYRTTLPLTKKGLGKKFRYLYFEGADEQAWLYLNGHPLFERTVQSTGMVPQRLWLIPFSVSLNVAELRGQDLLTVRVHSIGGMGGLWKPVHLVLTDQEMTEEQLHALFKIRDQQARDNKNIAKEQ